MLNKPNPVENKYYVINKPYGVLSQFSKEGTKKTLADLGFTFPKDVYPVGRLDEDSEGLLLLTNDNRVNHKLLHPDFLHKRTYYVQVDGTINQEALQQLLNGVTISHNGTLFEATALGAQAIEAPDWIWERTPPVRYRAQIPTSWASLTLTAGKNRQVRKMTAKVGFPTLRLIRYAIEKITLDEAFMPGIVRELTRTQFYSSLNI